MRKPVTVPLKTRILLADDHEVVRDGLRMVLDSAPDLEVVAEAGDGAEAVELALSDDVDLAVLDVTMPRMTGLQAAQELSRRKPELRVLILSMHDNEQYFFEALKAGASGYVLKTRGEPRSDRGMPGDDAWRAVPLPGGGEGAGPRLSRPRQPRRDNAGGSTHSRELEVVKLIAEGLTSDEIADAALHQQEDRRPASGQRAREARHAKPRRADPLRDPSRPSRP